MALSGLDAQERRAIEAAMIYRYGQLVELHDADIEVKLTPGSEEKTFVPGVYWNERKVQFVVIDALDIQRHLVGDDFQRFERIGCARRRLQEFDRDGPPGCNCPGDCAASRRGPQ